MIIFRWQLRRASVVVPTTNNTETKTSRAWTMTELRKEKQLQNDLDIPLTIFMTYSPRSSSCVENQTSIPNRSSTSLRITNIASYQPVLQHICTLEKHIQEVIMLTRQLIEKQTTVDVGSFELRQLCREDSFDGQLQKNFPNKTLNRRSSFRSVRQFESISISTNYYKFFPCSHPNQEKDNQPSLPSLRHAVDLMLASLIQFLYANNHFIRTELVSIQSIGDILAFHTLSYALTDMVEATTDLAKNARRIKHIETRPLISIDREEKVAL
jgi:hypothetical protein